MTLFRGRSAPPSVFGATGGSAIALPFTQDAAGLHVTLPAAQPYTAVAYALKITKSGTAPPATMTAGVQ